MRADRRWRYEAASAPVRALPSVRARSTLAAGLVVFLALSAGAGVLFYVLQRSMLEGIDQVGSARASDIADRVNVVGESQLDQQLKTTARDDQIVQVVNQWGRVVASSRGDIDPSDPDVLDRPFTGLRAAPGQTVREHAGPRKILDKVRPYLVQVRGVSHDGQNYSIIVASSFQPQRTTIQTLIRFSLIGLPLAVLLVSGATWFLVGGALRPVEAIRSRVQGIGVGAADLDERVPMPTTRDEVFRLAGTMNQMLDRLQTAQQAQRQFVADASHELRSPLATLAATLEVAAADPTGTAWADLHEVMSEETGRMAVLVENLLLLAKVDDQGLVLHQGDVDLDDLLEEETRRVRAATRLQVLVDVHPVRVEGDVLRLGQAIRNLVDNASRYARTRIRLTLRAQEGFAMLAVEDDGPGIPGDERERVFERFVRLDDSRDRASGGSGLGLPIVREIVRGHGGSVEIRDSALGSGTAVVIQLPLADEHEPEPAQPPEVSIR